MIVLCFSTIYLTDTVLRCIISIMMHPLLKDLHNLRHDGFELGLRYSISGDYYKHCSSPRRRRLVEGELPQLKKAPRAPHGVQ